MDILKTARHNVNFKLKGNLTDSSALNIVEVGDIYNLQQTQVFQQDALSVDCYE